MARHDDACWSVAACCLIAALFAAAMWAMLAPLPTRQPRHHFLVAPPAHARQVSANVWHADAGNNTREVYILHLTNQSVVDAPVDSCCTFLDFHHKSTGYNVEIRQPPSTSFEQAIRAGFSKWQLYSPIFNSVVTTNEVPAAAYDGANVVSFGSIDLPDNVIAVTRLYVSTTTDILLEADQVYNIGDLAIGFGSNDFHLPTVARHETGHWVGFADTYASACRSYIMFGVLTRGEQKPLDDNTVRCLGKEPLPGNEEPNVNGTAVSAVTKNLTRNVAALVTAIAILCVF